ncbi:MAG: hypothetical protein GTN38_00965 [Candidatus Aenigmarchaeota archaeon]|nr:hypothetical protein [Candidatus Aenigmarchaeota archaeon]NIP40158.1 hypothetical protein [Candidatus Aenigmarchaeota archaeon]NIQ17202.1 hypothetical protein [Candidatus Aenigmarchaeota archaeon]NIS72992.1 hypothetical protein [Candidatus Aenigmarchaeota archaeon]
MTRSKGSFGTEFTTGNVLQIFLVLIGAFLITGLIISASGGIQGMLEKLCDAVPQLCGEGETSSEYYEISKHSTEALWHAANIVMTGEKKYSEATYTQLPITGAVTASFADDKAEEMRTIDVDIYGSVDYIAACESVCEKETPKCDCIQCGKEKGRFVIVPNPNMPIVRKTTLKCTVVNELKSENKSRLFCDVRTGYPDLQYDESCSRIPLVHECKKADIYYTFDLGEWKWKCPSKDIDEYKPLSEMTGILNDVDDVHKEIKKEFLVIDPSLTDDEKYGKGLDVLRDAVLDESDSFGQDDKIIIHYKNEETEEIKRKDLESDPYLLRNYASLTRNTYAKCIVKNFHLPQDVTKKEEWIAGYGDPEFLVYWQKFPEGEDRSWTGFSTWLNNVFTVVIWGIPASEFLGAAKNFVVGGAKKLAGRVASKTGGLIGKLAKKITGKSVANMADDAAAIFVFREGVTRQVDKQLIRTAYEAYGSEQIAKAVVSRSVRTGLDPVEEELVRKGMQEGAELIGKGSYQQGIHIIGQNFDKIADTGKAGLLNKFMNAKGFNPKWADYKRVMKIAGVTTGGALLGAFIDSINAKYEEHPQSILLKSPYKDPEPHALEKERPMVLYKNKWTGKIGITENYAPFYLASPCHADLELIKKEIVCDHYIKDLADESIICVSPGNQNIFETLFKEAERCEYFPTNVNENDFNKDGKFLENEANLKETGLGTTVLFGSETVDGEDMIVIYDPIQEVDYYFSRTSQKIEYIKYEEGGLRKMEEVEKITNVHVKCGMHPQHSLTDDPLEAYGYEIEDENSIMGFAYEYDKVFACIIKSQDVFKDDTAVILYGNLTSDDKLDFFFSIVSEKSRTVPGAATTDLPTTFIILKDENQDSIVDVLTHSLFTKKVSTRYTGSVEWFPETNRTFTKEMEAGTHCKTDGVIVNVNKDPYKDDENNFCFTSPQTGVVTVIFVGTIVADVIAGAYTGGAGTIVAHTVIGIVGGVSTVYARSVEEWP